MQKKYYRSAVVTAEAIAADRITITPFKHLLPKDTIGGHTNKDTAPRSIKLHYQGRCFETDIPTQNGRIRGFIRNRSLSKKVYAEALPGDVILFEEITPYEYVLHIETSSPQISPSAEDTGTTANDLPVIETESEAVIVARIGQSVFRSKLDIYWQGCCAVTACSERALLRASHIQPWRDSTNTERLNPYNGLLLSAHLDAAFDNGLISFDDTGKLLLHPEKFSAEVAATVGINSTMRLKKVDPQHLPFLSAHRSMHGFATCQVPDDCAYS